MGGNVKIGNITADRIKITDRAILTHTLDKFFRSINDSFEQLHKEPIWAPLLLENKSFLSGSAYHLFDFDKILNNELSSVGDIDTQISLHHSQYIRDFLSSYSGEYKLLGFEDRGNQLISLWHLNNQNVQVDFELVEFNNGMPTEWAKFSHSSEWVDKKCGIKGVFHKYILRAFTTKTLKDRCIQMKKSIKKITSTDLAFSVDYGIRSKYIDLHQIYDGLPVYKEIPVKESTYVNTIDEMFFLLFEKHPTLEERELFKSFKGCLQIANTHLSVDDKIKLISGFENTLFGPGAQELYRDDKERDSFEKQLALSTMLNDLNI